MKKLLMVFLCVLLLLGMTGCKKKSESNDGAAYVEKIKNFKVREKNPNNTVDNKEFDAYLDKVFKDTIEESYLSMHSSVVDYRKLGLEKPEVSWGELEYGKDEAGTFKEQLDELLKFDYDTLSYRQQYDYETLEYSLYETLADLAYSKYTLLYSGGVDTMSSIMTNLTDFVFHDKEDLDDYMTLLKDTDRYVEDCNKYTEAQIKDGIRMIDYSVDYTTDYLDRVLSKTEDNALITSFDKRMESVDFLTDAEKETYKEENRKIVLGEILPVFRTTRDFVADQKGKVKDPSSMALCKLDKTYAELRYILNGSNNEPIDTVFEKTKTVYDDLLADMLRGVRDQKSYEEYMDATQFPSEDILGTPREVLDYLSESLDAYYPHLGEIPYDVDEIDASAASDTVLAYYWQAPLDNLDQNIIRVNPNNLSNDPYEAYTTLAHEGFPGHLYQHVYYHKTDPAMFRNVIGFIGYTEGYAVQAQVDALHFGNVYDGASDALKDMLTFDSMYYFPLYSVIDMGINYYGWNTKQVGDYLEESMLSKDYAQQFMEMLIDMPGVYCSYGLGYTNFVNLRNYAKEALGSKFDIVKYNETILKNGPLPFNILKGAVDEYIAANK